MAFSTSVSLLSVDNNLTTLKTGLLGYWDFENTLNSYTGVNPFVFNGTINSGSNDPSKDINVTTITPKLDSYSLKSLAYNNNTPDSYYASVKPSISPNKTKGTACGWFKIVAGSAATSYSFIPVGFSTTGSSGLAMGVNIVSSTSISDTAANLSFIGGSTLATVNPTNWIFVVFWYDFSDTSQGANGSQYLQINNGTVYARQSPVIGTTTDIVRAAGLSYNPFSTNYVNGFQVDAFALYNRVLTSTERSNLYNSGTGLNYSQLY